MNTQLILVALVCVGSRAVALTTTSSPPPPPTPARQPVYEHDPMGSYIPHEAYPYADAFMPNSGYEGYLIPGNPGAYQPVAETKSVMSSAQGALHVMLKVLAKVGLFLLGGVALLLVGGVFTTADLNQDTVRAYMTPERVANAAAFVEKAVDKYQRIQRAIDGLSGY